MHHLVDDLIDSCNVCGDGCNVNKVSDKFKTMIFMVQTKCNVGTLCYVSIKKFLESSSESSNKGYWIDSK